MPPKNRKPSDPKRIVFPPSKRAAPSKLRKIVMSTPPQPQPPTKSKFFFDMLMALDMDLVLEHILPHLPKINSNTGWLPMIMVHGEEAGLLRRSFARDFLFPLLGTVSPNESISFRSLILSMHTVKPSVVLEPMNAAEFVQEVSTKCNMDLCLDIIQCKECRCPVQWYSMDGLASPASCHGKRYVSTIHPLHTRAN